MSDETNLYFNLDDEDNEKRVVVRVSELVRCLKHFRESLLCNGGDYEHDMREIGGHLKAATLGGGTLTAEQVREAIERHSTETLGCRRQFMERDWQAIADELNAELGSGTCELHDCDGSFSAVNRPVWRCDCGAFMTQYIDATTYHKPRFCPNCGARIRKAVKR